MKPGSQNYWIKAELSRHFANLNFEKGVDLDRNGQIEGSERTDVNDDGKVDVSELKQFLKANQPPLENLGGFFKIFYSCGQAFSPGNPIHDLLFIESEIVPTYLVEAAYQKVEQILNIVKQPSLPDTIISNFHNPTEKDWAEINWKSAAKLKTVYDAMREIGIAFEPQEDALFAMNLSKGVLDCDTSSFVMLAIAHEMNWPVYLVLAPQVGGESHMFVRWDDGKYRFNVDQGAFHNDRYYTKKYGISADTIDNGVFLKNLTQDDDVLALHFVQRSYKKLDRGDPKGAVADLTEFLRRCTIFREAHLIRTSVHNKRGVAELRSGRFEEARKDFLKVWELNPNYTTLLNLVGLSFIPDHLSFAISPLIGSDDVNAHTALGATWPFVYFNEDWKTGPHFKLGYSADLSRHLMDVSAGWAFMYKDESSMLAAEVGAGYNFPLAGDASEAPIRDGAIFQYGLRYNYRITDSLGVGVSVMLQHEMLNPDRLAILPGAELTYLLWK